MVLVILDGWGFSPIHKGNAIWSGKTPAFDYIWKKYSHSLLGSFGVNVGLPWGAIGSSEVGHTSIGSGILIHQELSLVDKEISDGGFFANKELLDFLDQSKKDIHLIGLVSNGGVHSHLSHLYALLDLLDKNHFKGNIFIHAITDGRDTSPKSSLQYISELEDRIKKIRSKAIIASISGRYYAMDRDSRWDRTKKAFLVMTGREKTMANSVDQLISSSYKQKITDEFIKPSLIKPCNNSSFLSKILSQQNKSLELGYVKPGDNIIFFNIRPDRMRQLVEMFLFHKKEIGTKPVANTKVLTLTTYDELLPVKVAYPSVKIKNPIAKLISENGYTQGHFAETEKYAHVTYFFNGGNPKPYHGEIWKLAPSPKVSTYDLKPEMSASEITDNVFKECAKHKLDFILINYANADMVGHTGKFDKVKAAVEAVDKQIKRILDKFEGKCPIIITADHGNAECMIHPETGEIDKKHTVNPVPLILVDENFKLKKPISDEDLQPMGILADIAVTALDLLKIKKDPEMTGVTLLGSLKPDK